MQQLGLGSLGRINKIVLSEVTIPAPIAAQAATVDYGHHQASSHSSSLSCRHPGCRRAHYRTHQNKDLLFKSSPIHHQHGSPLPISVPHNHTQISLNSNTHSIAIPTHKLNAKLCSSLELLSSAIQSHQTPSPVPLITAAPITITAVDIF
ncbi:hypothetical protein M0R45_019581 [Rubus argutus]|uniref:Uncharacterized protein n=1 Tax=Rubus argutus TaxID=59490 RepID=A0AAW1X9G6_RUBAR